MKKIEKINWDNLKHEYGVDGQRLLPWDGDKKSPFPFGGAYCIARSKTTTLEHINDPDDEQEMFIAVSGKAFVYIDNVKTAIGKGDVVYIPSGQTHYVTNPFEEDFHFYALWWNKEIISEFNNSKLESWQSI